MLTINGSVGRKGRNDVEDVALTVHAHPTLSEAVKEAALLAKGQGIHFYSESRGERA